MNIKATLKMIWLLSYISIASVSAAIITPALPNIEMTFYLTTGSIEWVVSIFLIGYVIGQLIYAPLANVYGRIKALKWGLNINLLGLLLCIISSFYPNYALLLMGRLITGLGAAAGLTCTFMLINEWLPEEQRKIAMSYSILSFALGVGLAVLIGGVITQYSQWQFCFLFLLVHGIVMRFGIRVFQETLLKPRQFQISALIKDYKNALSSFQLIAFACIWGASTVVGYCYSAAAPQIANQYLHLSASQYGYWNIINIIGMLVGGLSARVIIQRRSITQVIAMGFMGSFFAVLSLVLMWYLNNSSIPWFFISTSVLYCFSSYLFAGGSYMASNAIEDKASGSSMMSFINMGVATLSVVVMGYLSPNPFVGFLWILIDVFFIALILWLVFKVRATGLLR